MLKKTILLSIFTLILSVPNTATAQAIDRRPIVERNNPHVERIDSLSPLTVGNGRFAVTVDATGTPDLPRVLQPGRSSRHVQRMGVAFLPEFQRLQARRGAAQPRLPPWSRRVLFIGIPAERPTARRLELSPCQPAEDAPGLSRLRLRQCSPAC